MELAKIKKQFDSLDEQEQWKWLIDTDLKPHFTVFLDNDDTHIYFEEDTEADYVLRFKDDIGNRQGVNNLLMALGVNVQDV